MSYSPEEYHAHIEKLAHELGCTVYMPDPGTPGMMYVEFGYVEGPSIVKETPVVPESPATRYMVNLHELGHFALGHTQGRPPKSNEKYYFDNGVLRSEAEAWEWALNQRMDEPLGFETIDFMRRRCIGSYLLGSYMAKENPDRLWNGNRHHVEFIWDKPDEYFWSICDRLERGI